MSVSHLVQQTHDEIALAARMSVLVFAILQLSRRTDHCYMSYHPVLIRLLLSGNAALCRIVESSGTEPIMTVRVKQPVKHYPLKSVVAHDHILSSVIHSYSTIRHLPSQSTIDRLSHRHVCGCIGY